MLQTRKFGSSQIDILGEIAPLRRKRLLTKATITQFSAPSLEFTYSRYEHGYARKQCIHISDYKYIV